MKTRTLLFVDTFYLVAMSLISLFYVFANFDKEISGQLGFAQLLFTVIAILVYVISVSKKKGGLPTIFYILYSIAQCVATFFWIYYFDATFHIFPNIVAINWLGLTVHLLLLAWSVGMVVIKKRRTTL